MSDTYQIVFIKAGDDSPASKNTVAQKISVASKTPVETLLKQIEGAPFVYKRGLPKAKAEAISAALNRLGAVTEVSPDGTPVGAPPPVPPPVALPAAGGFDFGAPPADAGGGFDFDTPADSGGAGFDVGASTDGGGADSGGGFDFGTPAADSDAGSGFDFDTPSADSGGGSGFDFAAPADASDAPAVGGFAPASSGGDDFAMEEPAPAADAGGGGFDFSVDAAQSSPAPAMAEPDVAVERNLDYASSSGEEAAAAPPPVQRAPTVTCPRCNEEVPDADECAACGVLLDKAGESAPAATRRPRTGRKVKKKRRSPATAIAAVLVVLVVGGAVGFVLGAFNPVRLMFRAKSDPTLKEYGVDLGPPDGQFTTAEIGDGDRAADVRAGFVERAQRIEQEIERLSGLNDVAQFDAGIEALRPEMEAYAGHGAVALQSAIRTVNSGLYSIRGIGLELDGTTYSYYEDLEVDGAPSGATPLLSEPAMRRKIDEARQVVRRAEEIRVSREEAESVNVDFFDDFATAIDPRWREEGPDGMAQQTGGWLYITATPDPIATAPRLVIGEPLVDYTVEVTVDGEVSPDVNAGLVLIAAPDSFVALTRAPGRRGIKAQIVTKYGPSSDTTTTQQTQLRIVKKGELYKFSAMRAGRWETLDEYQAFDEGPRRRLGLTAFGGQGGAFFKGFKVTIHR